MNYRAKGKSFKDEAVWLSGMENLECGRRVISDVGREGRGKRDEGREGRGKREVRGQRSEVGGRRLAIADKIG